MTDNLHTNKEFILKKFFQSSLLLSITLAIINVYSFCEAATARVAVLPFKINAQKDFTFLQTGIQDMLSSRLSWKNRVSVIGKDRVNEVAKSVENFTGKSRALLIGGKLNADYIIYGSLTIMGENASIDAQIIDISGKHEPTTLFKQIDSAGQVIPEINRFATDINTTVFNRPSTQQFQSVRPSTQQFRPAQPSTPNQQFISTPNQNFLSMGSSGPQQAFWKSKTFKHVIVGMDFGDVNNDGIKETVFISNHAVYIYQKSNDSFTQIAKVAENKINS